MKPQRNTAPCCTTRSWEDGTYLVKGQLLLYPTLNMAGIKDEYFNPGMDQFEMAPKQKRGLSKMIGMFGGMTTGLKPILGTDDVKNDYLNPYTRDTSKNSPTFLTVGEHDFLKIETLGYGVKLHNAGVETQIVLYKGFGHAFLITQGFIPSVRTVLRKWENLFSATVDKAGKGRLKCLISMNFKTAKERKMQTRFFMSMVFGIFFQKSGSHILLEVIG